MPGCTYGFHSNEKPPPAPKVKSEPLPDAAVIKGPPPKAPTRAERPDISEEQTVLKSSIGATLKQALEKRMASLAVETNNTSTAEVDEEVKIGTACKNSSCKSHYEGPESNTEECIYHPGVPVFHEGMKFWSCCQKKTTEFDKFLEQVGCTSGKHKWVASPKDIAMQNTCRMDWHQTSANVIISVFSKCADPTKTVVKANQVSVDIYIVYEDDKIYSESFELNGVINVDKSSVKLLGAKVEITLKKAEAASWGHLRYQPQSKDAEEGK